MTNELRSNRAALGISQSRLARISGVSRFKICLFEIGDGQLSVDEENRIRGALNAEIDRLRNLLENIDFRQVRSSSPQVQVE
jgi:predicted transcriptional regulator